MFHGFSVNLLLYFVICNQFKMSPVLMVSMKPKAKKIDHALDWMPGWKTRPAFRKRLASILIGLDFPNNAKKVLG
jgi:hypothetical protein